MHYPLPAPLLFSNDFFSLTLNQNKTKTIMVMRLHTPIINTSDLPQTCPILQETLPSIFKAQCFNELKLPFAIEIKNTEVGHLFEHIILEYLCILMLEKGKNKASFSGFTNWNWKKEERGTFHIQIQSGYKNAPIFSEALEKSMNLLTQIIRPRLSQPNLRITDSKMQNSFIKKL